MAKAFEELSLTNYDVTESVQFHYDQWMQILSKGATAELFYEMFKNVDSVTDLPACYFWEEIHQAFPDAKIIFTERASEEEWLESFTNQFKVHNTWSMSLMGFLSPSCRKLDKMFHAIWISVFGFYPHGNRTNDLLLRKQYRMHNSYLKREAPKDKLLLFKLKDGWEPLCEFLNLPIPNKPFPHRNKKGAIVDELFERNPLYIRIKNESIVSGTLLICLSSYAAYKLLTCDHRGIINYATSPFSHYFV